MKNKTKVWIAEAIGRGVVCGLAVLLGQLILKGLGVIR